MLNSATSNAFKASSASESDLIWGDVCTNFELGLALDVEVAFGNRASRFV